MSWAYFSMDDWRRKLLRSYVCLIMEGRMSPVGPGRSIDIPCEGRMPAASLSLEVSGSSLGGDIECEEGALED